MYGETKCTIIYANYLISIFSQIKRIYFIDMTDLLVQMFSVWNYGNC